MLHTLPLGAEDVVRRATGPAIATDAENRILSWNRAARELLEYGPGDDLAGENLNRAIQARDPFGNRLAAGHLAFWEMIERGEDVRRFEIDACKADGEHIRLEFSVVVVLGARPDSYQLVYLLHPVLHRRKADEVIERVLANPLGGAIPRLAEEGGPPPPALTPRQIEVLRHLAEGDGTDEIAAALGITLYTVRSHVQAILEKLQVHSQTEAVARAFRDRLL